VLKVVVVFLEVEVFLVSIVILEVLKVVVVLFEVS
tara:strand:+ start:1112 stop:1216 length:105 start_codon:yes stop_codon:yes gene_type:complete